MCEKYKVMARDAQLMGDRVLAESHFQHADHFARLHLEAGDQPEKAAEPKAESAPASNTAADKMPDAGSGQKESTSNKGNGSVKAQKVPGDKGAAKADGKDKDAQKGNHSEESSKLEEAPAPGAEKPSKTAVAEKTKASEKATDASSDAG